MRAIISTNLHLYSLNKEQKVPKIQVKICQMTHFNLVPFDEYY